MSGLVVPLGADALHEISREEPSLLWYIGSGVTSNFGGSLTITCIGWEEPLVPWTLYGVHVYMPWWDSLTRSIRSEPLVITANPSVSYGSRRCLSRVHMTNWIGGFAIIKQRTTPERRWGKYCTVGVYVTWAGSKMSRNYGINFTVAPFIYHGVRRHKLTVLNLPWVLESKETIWSEKNEFIVSYSTTF